ncbi:Uncharacterised protein [Burkholderia pseudomallei]|nr:hypothetical protein DP55_933 [Burkholderia pseudomallei]KGU78928.1 hypothetical protein Y038_1418 [Burkholderia pseudomallei MSHR543]KGW38835.1 hypothetical protein Y597_542 [Burkholderia pseudomallei MSHR1000]KGX19896.1 hypothetical protein X896_1055 [Burkholderia pseudomallei ABCPW 1]KGC28905.1 hypothetical protein DO62_340 [Burkholderia pseudomallei]
MKLVRDARTLRAKAIASIKIAMTSFNSFEDEGRVCTTLLHLQHACEMLLKAALVQRRVQVFDKSTGMSISFDKCLRLCRQSGGLSEENAGIMRTVDALRDASQHWFLFVSEELLYMHTRALVTAFDAYLKQALNTDLHRYIPSRVLPVSTKPSGDLEFLIDKEYELIGRLLRPGKRHRDEARARVRSLLAMEALIADNVEISEKDIDRIEKAIRSGEAIGKVFPRLLTISTSQTGEGVTLKVQFSKKDGAPVRYIGGDDPEAAAAVREVDLRKRFYLGASDLAKKLGLTEPRSKALRWHFKIDEDDGCHHIFEFGKSKFMRFSDNAYTRIKGALSQGLDIDAIWAAYRVQLHQN